MVASSRRQPDEPASGVRSGESPSRGEGGARTPRPPADLIALGRILGAYGVRGWVRVEPYAPAPESALRLVRCWWLASTGATEVQGVRTHGDQLVAKFAGVDDREGAARLGGQPVLVSRADFPSPGDREYYWVDLIGCELENLLGEKLGTVVDVREYGADPILVARREGRPGEILVPFVTAIIEAVDVPARRIRADWVLE